MGLEALSPEAEVLLALLGLEKEHYAYPERPISPLELRNSSSWWKSGPKECPALTFTGRKEFMSLEFLVNPQAVDSRPEQSFSGSSHKVWLRLQARP